MEMVHWLDSSKWSVVMVFNNTKLEQKVIVSDKMNAQNILSQN